MNDTENQTALLDFGEPSQEKSMFHLIALGDRAALMLNHLRADFGDWFIEGLPPYEVGDKPARALIVLADESSSIELLLAVYSDEDFIKHYLFVLDISPNPQPEKWPDACSYIWFSPTRQYATVKHFFQMYYHDSFQIRSLICFDFSDWRWMVQGKRRVVIHKFAVNDDLSQHLLQTPLSEVPKTRAFVIQAIPFEMVEDNDFGSMINTNLFARLDDIDFKWTIVGQAPSLQEAYIALMEFIPLSNPVGNTL